MKKAKRTLRVVWVLTTCALLISPAGASLQVSDGVPVTGAEMGGANGAVEVTVTAPRAIIDWTTLDTEAGELLKFMGADGYAVLNRVNQGKRTDFMGNLEALGGNIIIVNQHGIVFGPQSLVQAAKFTASSLIIDQQDFLDGNHTFTAQPGVFGEIVNEGRIHVRDQAALLAQRVINKGTIVCDEGAILMAAGDKIVLGSAGSNVVVEVTGVTPIDGVDTGRVINRGALEAKAGDIILAAGDTFAQSLTIPNVGRVENYGQIEAAGNFEAAAGNEVVLRTGSDTQTAGDVRIKAGSAITVEEDLVSGGDMTLISGGLVKTRNASLASGGDMHITSGTGNSIAVTGGITSGGDMLLEAGTFISVRDDMISGGDLTINTGSDKTFSTGNLIAEGDITLRTFLELSGGRWVPDGSGIMVFEGQRVEARTGTLTAHAPIWKMTPGELYLYGGSEGLAVDIRNTVASSGNMYIAGEGDIQVSAFLIAVYPSSWMPDPPAEEVGYMMPHNIGGVSVISKNGKIYTRGTDRLNAWIFGYSNDIGGVWDGENYMAGGAGVDLPYRDPEGNALGKAAIVLQSKETLVLGQGANLVATGYYLPAGGMDDGPVGVDDRPGVDFLAYDAAIGGYNRNQGVASDVAIYVGSTSGDVVLETRAIAVVEGAPHFIFDPGEGRDPAVYGPATVVLDAYDTVAFSGPANEGDRFDDFIGGFRLEVCSRRTEWLDQAIAWGTLPYADNPAFMEDHLWGEDYVLRGAGGSNFPPGQNAWVLENEPPINPQAAPLPHFEYPQLKGCPVELSAAANELGITGDRLQIMMGASLASNPNIQACDACARLIRAAAILKDFDGSHLAAMNRVFNQLAPADAPFTPETAASIVVAFAELSQQRADYALAAAYSDAFVEYVAAMGDLGSPAGDSVAYVLDKHGKALTENANSNVAAFVAARLERIDG